MRSISWRRDRKSRLKKDDAAKVVGLALAVIATGGLLARRSKHRRQSNGSKVEAFQTWNDLTKAERAQLLKDVKDLDIDEMRRILEASKRAASIDPKSVTPVPDRAIVQLNRNARNWQHPKQEESAERKPLFDAGLALIAEGKVAVLCLAGGQGTRLGSSDPKGMFDIGLPSGKSLFQLQAERIWRAQAMSAHISSPSKKSRGVAIPWIILTSPATDAKTRAFFEQQNHFGLDKEQVHFVVQAELPCMTEDGTIILESKEKAARAPNGNGGLFPALIKYEIVVTGLKPAIS